MSAPRGGSVNDAGMPEAPPPARHDPAPAVCRRCGAAGPVGDDGFCPGCEKALEQACL